MRYITDTYIKHKNGRSFDNLTFLYLLVPDTTIKKRFFKL